ncbi:hypothetical protein PsorP6_015737 [Peronosclerospora sorghi]|uniref:Uncharacterized protein n=1 Tax=Peronosclerospora sorghi TaxID=230839 RepID=A0ACC0WPW3_9STRA|nr:hypothetical protein PsorP6_015737 [Peronosclerospora sorghi]
MASLTHAPSRKTERPLSRVCLLSRDTPFCTDAATGTASARGSVSVLLHSVLYALLQAMQLLPPLYGFAALLFSHATFSPYLPCVAKLVLFASAVHHVFCTFMSPIPRAVGHVQPLSLLFLSAMTTSICTTLHDSDDQDVTVQAKVVTSIVAMSLATFCTGVALVCLGHWKLATTLSCLPLPVLGGYMAYTGQCLVATAAGFSTGNDMPDSFTSLGHLLSQSYNLSRCLPGLLGGTLLFAMSKRCTQPVVQLGLFLVLMPLVFYAMLLGSGTSVDQARKSGWLPPTARRLDVSSLFDSSIIYWSHMPRQVTTWLAMVLLVASSSILHVRGLESQRKRTFDGNQAVKTMGWANLVSGVCGGYQTGSSTFQQASCSHRTKKTNPRLVGVGVILLECLVGLLPLSFMSYVPRFWIAATLVYVALDFLTEWLVLAHQKMNARECTVLWLTFLSLNYCLVEEGLVLGLAMASLNFMLSYASGPVMTCRPLLTSSRQSLGESLVGLRPRFSAAVPMIGESVLTIRPYTSFGVRNVAQSTLFKLKRAAVVQFEFWGYLFFGSVVQILTGVQQAVYVRTTEWPPTDERASSLKSMRASIGDAPVACFDGSPAPHDHVPPTAFLVLDFTRVSGIDATVARSAFLVLHNYCTLRGIELLYAHVHPEIRTLLLKTHAATETSFYGTADAALEYCTTQIFSDPTDAIALEPPGPVIEPIRVSLLRYLNEPETSTLLDGVDPFFRQLHVAPGHVFYRIADVSDHFYFLARGLVTLFVLDQDAPEHVKPLQTVLPSSLFGEVFFLSQEPRQTTAIASQTCTVFEMSRAQFEAMKVQAPSLSVNFLDVIVQSMLK